MSITLKEETVLNQWSTLIDRAAGHTDELFEEIQGQLKMAQIPGGCTWSVEEIKSSTWVSRVRRDFLVIKLEQFSDYRNYVGIRDYGINMDVCRYLTCEPGFFKKKISEKFFAGDPLGISSPKNILVEQDLTAWATVAHHCVLDGVSVLLKKLGQDPSKLRRETKGVLEVW